MLQHPVWFRNAMISSPASSPHAWTVPPCRQSPSKRNLQSAMQRFAFAQKTRRILLTLVEGFTRKAMRFWPSSVSNVICTQDFALISVLTLSRYCHYPGTSDETITFTFRVAWRMCRTCMNPDCGKNTDCVNMSAVFTPPQYEQDQGTAFNNNLFSKCAQKQSGCPPETRHSAPPGTCLLQFRPSDQSLASPVS